MKTLFLNSFVFVSLIFGLLASDNAIKQPESGASNYDYFSPSGVLALSPSPVAPVNPQSRCFLSRGQTYFRVQIQHVSGTIPPAGSMDLIINGVDTGVNVSVGSYVHVPTSAMSVFINYPIGGGLTVLYAGMNSTEIGQGCTRDLPEGL